MGSESLPATVIYIQVCYLSETGRLAMLKGQSLPKTALNSENQSGLLLLPDGERHSCCQDARRTLGRHSSVSTVDNIGDNNSLWNIIQRNLQSLDKLCATSF